MKQQQSVINNKLKFVYCQLSSTTTHLQKYL